MVNYIELKTKLQICKSRNINYIQNKDIDNIKDIKINQNLPRHKRVLSFLENVKNPYIFNVDGRKVKFEFSEDGLSLNKCIENLILNRVKK